MNLKSSLKIFIFGFFIIFSCLAPQDINSTPLSSHSVINPKDELLDKIYAVHATHTLPDADYLRAGLALDHSTPLLNAFLPRIRKTLHFALGELVRPVGEDFMDWEDCPYAIVTPLRVLQHQLLNINCYDTFILGDLRLSPDTYLIIPIEMAEKVESLATLITYDPQNKTLREAVDELILLKGGWHIQMDNEDIEDELHEAYIGNENVNTAAFFEPLKQDSPGLAVGLRFDPLDGEHYRLVHIELTTMFVTLQVLSPSFQDVNLGHLKTSDLEESILSANKNFEQWSQSLAGFKWCLESQQAYQQIASEISKWENLIREELRIRNFYGKTFQSAPHDLLFKCASLLNDPKALQLFIDQNWEQLMDYPID